MQSSGGEGFLSFQGHTLYMLTAHPNTGKDFSWAPLPSCAGRRIVNHKPPRAGSEASPRACPFRLTAGTKPSR